MSWADHSEPFWAGNTSSLYIGLWALRKVSMLTAPPTHTTREARERPPLLPSLGDLQDEEEARTPVTPIEHMPIGRPRPYLVAIAGPRTGETFRLSRPLVIGRGPSAALRLADERVSRRHAEVRYVGGQTLLLRDLGSANGTYVRGKRVHEQLLRSGDRIELGDGNILRVAWLDPIEEQFQLQLADAALRDGLTHVYNRRYLRQRLCTELAFAQRHSIHVALLVVDVDHFKAVNDGFGHQAGDAVLQKAAEVMLAELRSEDVLARWGGEEFAVLARSPEGRSATALAERLRLRVAETHFVHEQPLHISIGVAVYPTGMRKTDLVRVKERVTTSDELGAALADALIGAADEALYRAKRTGRNRVVSSADLSLDG